MVGLLGTSLGLLGMLGGVLGMAASPLGPLTAPTVGSNGGKRTRQVSPPLQAAGIEMFNKTIGNDFQNKMLVS